MKLIKSIFYKLYFICASVTIRCRYCYEHKFGNLRYLSNDDFKCWLSAMLNLMKEHCINNYGFKSKEVYETFAKANIQSVRISIADNSSAPIVVLSVKNDIMRLKMLVEHYRSLEVKRFAIIDNNSDDGTFEWMLTQHDIDIFRTNDKYSSFAKEGWINRIISYYGFNRWYILTDSDELFTYIDMEKYHLPELIKYAELNGIYRLKGINVDMYSNRELFAEFSDDIDIKKEYCWMDSDSYSVEIKTIAGRKICFVSGGPRKRVMNVECSITKYPLVYFLPGTVSANAHYQFPYDNINLAPCCIGLLHYKFLDIDKSEFERRARTDSGFAKKGKYYRKYIDAAYRKVSFMYYGSVKYEDSKSLINNRLIERIPFEK